MIENTELRLYCLMRADIDDVAEGKLMAQAGHAFVNALEEARKGHLMTHDDITDEARKLFGLALVEGYMSNQQPKIVLRARNLASLHRAAAECLEAGFAHFLVTDEGRNIFPQPTVTCLGIGPVVKTKLPKFIQRMQIW